MPTILDVNPTQFGPLSIQAPKVQPVSVPSPLDVTNFFRSQQLGLQREAGERADRGLELQQRALELRDRQLTFEMQERLFDTINQGYGQAFSSMVQRRKQNEQMAMGLDPEFFSNDISQVNDLINESHERQLNISRQVDLSGNDPSAITQAIQDITSEQRDLDEKLRNNTRFYQVQRAQMLKNSLENNVMQKVAENDDLVVNEAALARFYDSFEDFARNDVPISFSRFTPDKFVFNKKDARTNLDAIVTDALGEAGSLSFLSEEEDPSLKGMTVTALQQQASRSLDEATALAIAAARNDEDIRGMADVLAHTQGTDRETALAAIVSNAVANKFKDVASVDKFVVTKQGTGSSSSSSSSQGQSELEKQEARNRARTREEFRGIDRVKRMGLNPRDYSGTDLEVIGEAVSVEPAIDEPDAIQVTIRRSDGGTETQIIRKITPISPILGPTVEGPPISVAREVGIDPGVIANVESQGGTNVVNPDDRGDSSIGTYQFRGQLFDDFMDEVAEQNPEVQDVTAAMKSVREKMNILVERAKEAEVNPREDPQVQEAMRVMTELWQGLNEIDPDLPTREYEFAVERKWGPAVEHAEDVFARSNLGKEVKTFIADIANQHGEWKRVIEDAVEILDTNPSLDPDDDIDILLALDQARIDYGNTLSGDLPSIVANRSERVLKTLMESLRNSIINEIPRASDNPFLNLGTKQ